MEVFDVNACFGFYPIRKVDASLETLSGILRKHNAGALVYSLKGVFYDPREGNAETLRSVEGLRGSSSCAAEARLELLAAATWDPRAYPIAFDELEGLRGRGFKALAFFPAIQGWPVGFKPFSLGLEAASKEGLPVMVHTAGYGSLTALLPLIRELDIPVIVSGVGYSLMGEAIAVLRDCENLYLETHLLNTPDALELLAREVGAGRLLFGSGAPLLAFEASYEAVIKSRLSEEEKQAILMGNALSLLEREGKCSA